MIHILLGLVKNKYFITTLVFLVWLSVFDRNNLISQYELSSTLQELKQQKQYYLSEIRHDRQTAHELKTDLKNLEKFAREKYLFKKDEEDLFVVVPEKKEK